MKRFFFFFGIAAIAVGILDHGLFSLLIGIGSIAASTHGFRRWPL